MVCKMHKMFIIFRAMNGWSRVTIFVEQMKLFQIEIVLQWLAFALCRHAPSHEIDNTSDVRLLCRVDGLFANDWESKRTLRLCLI